MTGSVERTDDPAEEPDAPTAPGDGTSAAKFAGLNLSKHYGGVAAVDAASLAVEAGSLARAAAQRRLRATLAGKLAAVIGPLVYGLVTFLTHGNHRQALLSTCAFFIAGLLLLLAGIAGLLATTLPVLLILVAFLLFAFLLGLSIVLGAQLNNAVQEIWPVRPARSPLRVVRPSGTMRRGSDAVRLPGLGDIRRSISLRRR